MAAASRLVAEESGMYYTEKLAVDQGECEKEGTLQGWGQGAAAVKRIRTVGGLLSSGLFVSS